MKANAPEKIYLQENTTTDRYDEWWPEWFEARAKDTDIEYVRTDAFIEKAISWLKEQDEIILVSFQEDFLERFRNYMKGENE